MEQVPKSESISLREQLVFIFKIIDTEIGDKKDSIKFRTTIAGTNFLVVFWGKEENKLSFGLFMDDTKYSRKTIYVDAQGNVTEDTRGIIPDFDQTDNEPDFSSISNEKIAVDVLDRVALELGPETVN
jgi:hypothetical protein